MTNKIELIIDTSQMSKAILTLNIGLKRYKKAFQGKTKSQIVLPLVFDILKEHSISLSDLSQISVNTGPGSYTGIRVGVTIAITLSFLFSIPVNRQENGKQPQIEYANDRFQK